MRAALGLVVVLSGCSFFAANGPRPPPGPTRCNLRDTPFVTDTIAAIGATVAAGVTSLSNGQRGDVIVPVGVAGVFGVSSVYGLVQVRRCRAERAKRGLWSLDEMPAVM